MIKHILITGASGYLGQHLLQSFLSTCHDQDITYYISAAYGSLASFGDVKFPVLERTKIRTFGNIDLSQKDSIDDLITQSTAWAKQQPIDILIHLAAIANPRTCEEDESQAMAVNCPVHFLKALPTTCDLIFLSTDHVYNGELTKAPFEDVDPIENPQYYDPPPVNTYGRSKLSFEKALREHDDFSSRAVSLRSSVILGPVAPLGPCRKKTFLQFVEDRMTAEESTDFFVDEFRNVVAVSDVVSIVRHFVTVGARRAPGVYNMGGADRVSRMDIAKSVARHLGVDGEVLCRIGKRFDGDPRWDGACPSPRDISMSMEKLTKVTGIVTVGLDEIIKRGLSS